MFIEHRVKSYGIPQLFVCCNIDISGEEAGNCGGFGRRGVGHSASDEAYVR